MNLQSLLEAINYANDNPKADPKIVAKFADIRPQDRSYYIMKWAEEKGIDGDDAMYMAGYVQDGYIGAGAWNWLYVGENIEEGEEDQYEILYKNSKGQIAPFQSGLTKQQADDKIYKLVNGIRQWGNDPSKLNFDNEKMDPQRIILKKNGQQIPHPYGNVQEVNTGKKIEEGEERSIIADGCVEKLVDEFGGRENQFQNKDDLEYAIYQALEDLDVEDCVDPEMEVGGQPIGDFASGRVIDCCSSSDIIYDVMANMDETQIGEGRIEEGKEGRWAIYIDGKDAQVRFKDYVDAGEMEDKMKKKYPSKEIELKKVGINEDEQKMIGTPDGYYDAEERTDAYNQLQDALAQSNRIEAEYVKDGHCPECPNVEDDEDCYGFGNYGCDDGELTYDGDTVSWKAIKDHDERQAQRQQAKANYPGDEAVIDFAASTAKQLKSSGQDPRDTLQYVKQEYPNLGRAQRASLVAKGMKKAGLTREGKSPHKKGSTKYKKHMAAKHASMGENMNENKWKEIETTSDYMLPVTMDNKPLDWPTYWEWEQSHGETNKNRASLRYGNYVKDAKQELDVTTEGEQHGNSKIYKKCWTGYSKVAGKKAGEKGSCKKNEGRIEDTFGTDTVDKHDKPKKRKKEESIQVGDELMIETADGEGIVVPVLHVVGENVLVGWDNLAEDIVIEGARQLEELRKLAGLDQINEITDESAKEVIMQILNSYGKDVDLETEFRNYFPRLSDKEVDYYLKGYKKPELKLVKNEAEYQGRKVKLGKPTRGDVKKFKVYVKDPKTGNVKKVNFGHGGTSAKKAGQKTMKIKKSNPARRKSFRARHNCDNPGPRTKARYWSCRAW